MSKACILRHIPSAVSNCLTVCIAFPTTGGREPIDTSSYLYCPSCPAGRDNYNNNNNNNKDKQ
jgi:hypothetical protein